MNPDDTIPDPYTPPMHLGKVVGGAEKSDLGANRERIAETERRILALEEESPEVGIAGKLRIEQSLNELRREHDELTREETNGEQGIPQ
jgi:hypothetical protein